MPDTSSGRLPWHARPESRIAAVVVAILLVTAAVAWTTQRGNAGGGGLLVATAPADTPTPAATLPSPEGAASAATPGAPASTPPTSTASPEASPSATPTVTSTAAAVETATATATQPPAPAVDVHLTPEQAGVGETTLVRASVAGASDLTLHFQGHAYPMVSKGDGTYWAIVGVPLDAALGQETLTVTARDASGSVLAERAVLYHVVPVERPVDYLQVTEEESSVLTPEAGATEVRLRGQQFAQFDPGRRWSGPFLVPVAGPMTTQFGQGRSINGGPVGGFHTGTDLANELGTPVVAAAPARVSWVGEMPIRGNAVILDHGSGVKTGYHHLSKTLVEVGQMVEAGEVIGLMGSTGFSTGPHLHWELTVYGVNVDPMTWTRQTFLP